MQSAKPLGLTPGPGPLLVQVLTANRDGYLRAGAVPSPLWAAGQSTHYKTSVSSSKSPAPGPSGVGVARAARRRHLANAKLIPEAGPIHTWGNWLRRPPVPLPPSPGSPGISRIHSLPHSHVHQRKLTASRVPGKETDYLKPSSLRVAGLGTGE